VPCPSTSACCPQQWGCNARFCYAPPGLLESCVAASAAVVPVVEAGPGFGAGRSRRAFAGTAISVATKRSSLVARSDHRPHSWTDANFASAMRRTPASADSSTARYSLMTSGAAPASRSLNAREYVSGKLRNACSRSLSWSATCRVCAWRAVLELSVRVPKSIPADRTCT
jgi:hypothetical protein